MSDASHAKFISSYHSNGEETEVPDLYYRYNQQFVNVYSRIEQNSLISRVTTDDLDNIAGEQQLTIQKVLEATYRKKPILMIVTTTSKAMDGLRKPIYVFWHRILEKVTKMIHFDLPMVGDISVVAMTHQPLVLVRESAHEIKKQKHVRHLLAFGKRDQSLQIALLEDPDVPDKRARGQVTDVKLPPQAAGDITALHILPQSTRDRRLGYGDPRIFVGTSDGFIQVLRFKTQFKKSSNGLQVELGKTWNEMIRKGKGPIIYLACKRALGNNKVMAAVAQERISNGNIGNGCLWVIEWIGNFKRKRLDVLTPTKLSSFTLTSTRIIPTLDNYQVTAIFQSTQNQNHFEIDVWTIENGTAKLVLSDEIFKHGATGTPQDIWPIHLTSRYMLLDHESDPVEVKAEIPNADTPASLEMDKMNELLSGYDQELSMNNSDMEDSDSSETIEPTSALTQDEDERYSTTTSTPRDLTIKFDVTSADAQDDIERQSDTTSTPSNLAVRSDDTSADAQDDIERQSDTTSTPSNSAVTSDDTSADAQDDIERQSDTTSTPSNLAVMSDDTRNNNEQQNITATVPSDMTVKSDITSANTQDDQEQHNLTATAPSDSVMKTDVTTAHIQVDGEQHNLRTTTTSDLTATTDVTSTHTQDAKEEHNVTAVAPIDVSMAAGSGLENNSSNLDDSGVGNDSHDDHTATTHANIELYSDNGPYLTVADDDDTTTTVTDNETRIFDDDSYSNTLPGSDTTSVANKSLSLEQSISSATIPVISRNEQTLLDNGTEHICKFEQNATGLGSNTLVAGISETTPSVSAEYDDVKQSSSPQIICLGNQERESQTPKEIYYAKLWKVTKQSLHDGLDMVREDETEKLNRQERLGVFFDIIFYTNTTTTPETDKILDIDQALETVENLSLDAMEKDWLMNYCFTHKNHLLQLFIMRYNIKHGNFGLVMMQHKTMKTIHTLEKGTDDIGRTCNNLTKLCQDMLPSVLQDLPLEIFGHSRGKVGNPFLNEQKSSLLQEKGLGLGGELLTQVMESRKRRRLD